MAYELNFDKEELQLIVFKLGSEDYTVPIESVQEIIMPQKPTHLPKSPDFVEGVVNLRGHIIPIIDGRKRFGLAVEEYTQSKRIIILELKSGTIGLIVDSVSEVVHLKTANIEAPPIEASEDAQFILGIGKFKDRLLILLDPDRFLSLSETESIKSTMNIAQNLAQSIKNIENQKSE